VLNPTSLFASCQSRCDTHLVWVPCPHCSNSSCMLREVPDATCHPGVIFFVSFFCERAAVWTVIESELVDLRRSSWLRRCVAAHLHPRERAESLWRVIWVQLIACTGREVVLDVWGRVWTSAGTVRPSCSPPPCRPRWSASPGARLSPQTPASSIHGHHAMAAAERTAGWSMHEDGVFLRP
jgi:hypothetical protein